MAFRDITHEDISKIVSDLTDESSPPESLPPFTAPEEWTQLCDRCKSALRGRATEPSSHGDYYDILLGRCKISKASLALALDEYCMICTPMAASFEKPEFADTLSSVDWENTSILYGSPQRVARADPEDDMVSVFRRSRPGRIFHDNCLRIEVSMHTLDKETGEWRSLFDESYELEPAQSVYPLTTRTLPSEHNVSSDNRILCRHWIETCQEDHSSCNNPLYPQAWRPKRLLELTVTESKMHVRLDDNEEHHVSAYATASYCWGLDANLLKLTHKGYPRFKHQIPMDDIPTTLQQIIILAYNLGFEYLWIDSLCIIQDSPEIDWPQQAALMGKIYACGTLNIAATGSRHAHDYLVYSRDIRSVQPCSVFVDVPGAPTGTYAIYPLHFIRDKLARRTVNTRGWVFQERLLSPRTLHVGSDQLFWECRESIACETFPQGLPRSLTHESRVVNAQPFLKSKLVPFLGSPRPSRAPQNPHRSKPSLTSLSSRLKRISISKAISNSPTTVVTNNDLESDHTKAIIYLQWRDAVEAYSECSFTKSKDRLWALQGIGDSAQVYLQDELVAGMWKKTLSRDLLWRRKTAARAVPEEPQAPLWSWAAQEGPIAFQPPSRWDHFPARILSISTPSDPRRPADALLTLQSLVFTAVLVVGKLVIQQPGIKRQRVLLDFVDSRTYGVACIVLHLPSHYQNPDGNFDIEMRGILVVSIDEDYNGPIFTRVGYFECTVAFGVIDKLCQNRKLQII